MDPFDADVLKNIAELLYQFCVHIRAEMRRTGRVYSFFFTRRHAGKHRKYSFRTQVSIPESLPIFFMKISYFILDVHNVTLYSDSRQCRDWALTAVSCGCFGASIPATDCRDKVL